MKFRQINQQSALPFSPFSTFGDLLKIGFCWMGFGFFQSASFRNSKLTQLASFYRIEHYLVLDGPGVYSLGYMGVTRLRRGCRSLKSHAEFAADS